MTMCKKSVAMRTTRVTGSGEEDEQPPFWLLLLCLVTMAERIGDCCCLDGGAASTGVREIRGRFFDR